MSYRQLFLLILTIWSAEICTRVLFDAVIHPTMEYRTFYLDKSPEGDFKGAGLEKIGNQGWQLVNAVPNPDNSNQMILFFQRQSVLKPGS